MLAEEEFEVSLPPKDCTYTTMPKPKVPRVSRDHYARAAYLLQTAAFHTVQGDTAMARTMARSVGLVAKRTVLRVSPHVKRQICAKCSAVWVPGLTVTMRVESLAREVPAADVLVHQCMGCGHKRRFPIGKDREYELHCDKKKV